MNTSNATAIAYAAKSVSTYIAFYGYYCLSTVILGTTLNLLTLFVLCRSTFRNAQGRPTIHYMRTIAVIDFLGVYGWNVDGYLSAIHGFSLTYSYSVASCKFSFFFNFWTLQTSAWFQTHGSIDGKLSRLLLLAS
ncbi:unnamed protein product [Adineta ricciae]|uniref:G-protein coupled receptors family 1 profile domain-containing protein n=1 Tax=Adineta ricciae TaxID=249248 RepID=A0A816ELH9_ADIRI|nr:unnamed protein product [Adineta ricciae]